MSHEPERIKKSQKRSSIRADFGLGLSARAQMGVGRDSWREEVLLHDEQKNVPTVANAIDDQSATEDTAFSFQVPENAFADVDAGDTLTDGATLSGGSLLPSWLSFDSATRAFSGNPTFANAGTVSVRVAASHGA